MPTNVISEITGTVWKMATAEGDAIQAGDPVLILESMKMEIPVPSPVSGKVVQLLVKPDDVVEEGQTIAEVEPG